MTAYEKQQFLPREPLDLPTDLPKEIPENTQETAGYDYSDQFYSVRELLTWSAPGRPFRKRGREYYLSGILITLLTQVILFLFSQYLLMLVVLSLVFVAFALVTVPPHDFNYKISSEGITVEDHFYLWQELYDFYFKKREGVEILHVRTKVLLPGELTLTLGTMDKEKVKAALLPYLPFREFVRPTFMEKSGDWLAKNFPLEKQV